MRLSRISYPSHRHGSISSSPFLRVLSPRGLLSICCFISLLFFHRFFVAKTRLNAGSSTNSLATAATATTTAGEAAAASSASPMREEMAPSSSSSNEKRRNKRGKMGSSSTTTASSTSSSTSSTHPPPPPPSEQQQQQQQEEEKEEEEEEEEAAAAQDPSLLVKEILRLGNAGTSPRGKKYRSLVCSLTRNDGHLREFVVRNLLVGFAHIVIYDNNQVGKGLDYDIAELLAPFVAQGAVSHIPWNQNLTGNLLENTAKNDNSHECVQTYGADADWIAVMDTDEAFYMEEDWDFASVGEEGGGGGVMEVAVGSERVGGGKKKKQNKHKASITKASTPKKTGTTGIGALGLFLDALEERSPATCGISLPWRMMYGEHHVVKAEGELLMDLYRRICKIHQATKLMFRPEWSDLHGMPHGMSCTNENGNVYLSDEYAFKQLMPEYAQNIHLVHYYQKSVQEWLVKMEQSIPPYVRYLQDSYDHVTSCAANLQTIYYTPEYEQTVTDMILQLRQAQGKSNDGGKFLGPLPEFKAEDLKDDPNLEKGGGYPLYLYFKLKVAQGMEWDEERYLAEHPEIGERIKARQMTDGLQHFMEEGFATGWEGTFFAAGERKAGERAKTKDVRE